MKVTIDYGEELLKARVIFENGEVWDFRWTEELKNFICRQGEDIYTLKSLSAEETNIKFIVTKNGKISDLIPDEVVVLPYLYKRIKKSNEEYFVKIDLLLLKSFNRATTNSQNVVISGSQGVSIVQSGDGKRTVIID